MIARCEYRGYVFTIHHDPDDPHDPNYYGVDFPDFRDWPTVLILHGHTLQSAFQNACAALDDVLEIWREEDKPAPRARYRLVQQEVPEPATTS